MYRRHRDSFISIEIRLFTVWTNCKRAPDLICVCLRMRLHSALRRWFHEDIPGHWEDFVVQYQKELDASSSMADFLTLIKPHPVITLLYASKEPVYNHARILRDYLEMRLRE